MGKSIAEVVAQAFANAVDDRERMQQLTAALPALPGVQHSGDHFTGAQPGGPAGPERDGHRR